VEPLPLQVFPAQEDNGYDNYNFLRDEEEWMAGREEVRGLQIMMGQRELLEDSAQGDLFI